MWGNQLNNRSPAEKMGVRGKLACATYTQTQVYLKPLLRKLKTKTLPEDISDSLTEITRYMLDRDYIQVCTVHVWYDCHKKLDWVIQMDFLPFYSFPWILL